MAGQGRRFGYGALLSAALVGVAGTGAAEYYWGPWTNAGTAATQRASHDPVSQLRPDLSYGGNTGADGPHRTSGRGCEHATLNYNGETQTQTHHIRLCPH